MEKSEIPTVKLRVTSAGNLRNFFFLFTILGIGSIVLVRFITLDSLIFQMTLPALVVFLTTVVIVM